MEATIQTIRKPCAAGIREAGRSSVDMPVLEARPLRIAGAATGAGSGFPVDDVIPSADMADGRYTASASRGPASGILTAALHGGKVALSDGTQIAFTTACPAAVLEASSLSPEVGEPSLSLQRYRGR
jgi:hypothetical protein